MKNVTSESHSRRFYTKRIMETQWPADDMCDPPTPANICLTTLIDELLGPNWYITMPESQDQVNTAATAVIIRKYVDDEKENRKVRLLIMLACIAVGIVIGRLL